MKMLVFTSLALTSLLLISFQPTSKNSAKKAKKQLTEFCEFIPSGSVTVEGDSATVQAFYMSSTEITNFQYAEFLYDLKKNGRTAEYEIAMMDTSAWTIQGQHLSGYQKYYHKHPAYHGYPVVNVSKQGAELYCKWLSEIYLELSGGELNLKFRIPTRAEWVRAAKGNHDYAVYSWGGPFLRNKQGLFLANHLRIGAENLTRNETTGELELVDESQRNYTYHDMDAADVTAPAKSYWPNDFGLYNMNGNVSEFVSDTNVVVGGNWSSPGYDIRNESTQKFEKPSPMVGFRVVATYLEESK